MNVEINAREYFEELELIEEQYGQEEDLYPWIYMLLQMAECSKDDTKKVSIRDVHKASRRLDLKGKTSYPEFLLFGRNKEKRKMGCIEIKKSSNRNILRGNFDKESVKISVNDEKELVRKVPMIKLVKGSRNPETWIFFDDVKDEKLIQNLQLYPEKYEIKENCLYYEEQMVQKFNDTIELKDPRIDWVWVCNNTEEIWGDGTDRPWEIMGHLEKFTNLLYTNGLEFYIMSFHSEQNEIIVKLLANLTEHYDKFKLITNRDDYLEPQEWKVLKEELIAIDWYKEYIC